MLVALNSGAEYVRLLANACERLIAHYDAEAGLWDRFAKYKPELPAKMLAQHEEVLELSKHGDVPLVRRFQALAQHNIIEEERDVYPVVARCFEF